MSGCKDAQTSNSLLVYLPLLCAVLYQWQRGCWTEKQIMSGCKDAQTSNSLLVYLPLLCAALYRWQRGRWTESRSWVAVCAGCSNKQLFIGVSSAALCSTLSVTKRALNREQIMSGCKDAQTSNSLLVYLPLLCAALYRWQRGRWTESRSWVAVRMLKQATLYWCFFGVSSAALCSTLSVTKRELNREQIMSGCKDAQTSNSLLVYLLLLCAALYRWQRGRWTESRSWVAVRMLKQATLYWCIFRCFVQHFIGDKEGAEQRADREWL